MQKKVLGFIFGLLFGCIFVGIGMFIRAQKQAVQDYKGIDGKVLSSEISSELASEGKREHTPKIKYSYSVDGKRYTGSKYSYISPPTSNSKRSAKNFIKQYPEGEECRVYYDPEDPSKAVLEKDLGGFYGLLPIILFAVGGLVIFGVIFETIKKLFSGSAQQPEQETSAQ